MSLVQSSYRAASSSRRLSMPKWSRGLIKKVRKVDKNERQTVFARQREGLILRSLLDKDAADTIQAGTIPQVTVMVVNDDMGEEEAKKAATWFPKCSVLAFVKTKSVQPMKRKTLDEGRNL